MYPRWEGADGRFQTQDDCLVVDGGWGVGLGWVPTLGLRLELEHASLLRVENRRHAVEQVRLFEWDFAVGVSVCSTDVRGCWACIDAEIERSVGFSLLWLGTARRLKV